MATVSKWTPFGVALDITATSSTVTRTSATQFTVKINASWETYYSGAKTNYGMTASSGGGSATINKFGTNSSSGSGSFTGTYSIIGNGSATKSITVTFKNFNSDNGKSATKAVTLSVSVPAWTSYKVTYNANGGSGAPSTQTKWKGQALTLSITKPTRSGYTFVGWGTSTTDTTADWTAGGKYTTDATDTLYAIWKKTITLSYNANGGSGAPASQSATIYNATTSNTFTVSNTTPTKSGYTFLGWSTSSSATSATYSGGSKITLTANDVLYAVWKTSYTAPKVSSYSVKRCTSGGTLSDEGTCAKVSFYWSTSVAGSSALIDWRSTDGTITGSKTVTLSTTVATGDTLFSSIAGNGALSTELSFVITTTVTDTSGGSVTKTASIPGLEFPIEAVYENGKYGVSFGKPAELTGYADFKYKTMYRDRSYFANNVSIHGTDPSDGTRRMEAFNPCNGNGNVIIGYGNYDAGSGNTHIYGYDVKIGVSNIATPGAYKPYFSRGDDISMTFRTAGYVTNGKKDVSFWVPLAKPIIGSPTATVDLGGGFIFRQGDKYTHGSNGASNPVVYAYPTKCTASVTTNYGIYVTASFTDTTNAVNNDPVGIYWICKITLS